ncbi:ATPase synthesis protein 25 mitochondrial [Kalmusia sp. IMI 367209]|nr:ATPase synthesis protein 25 mitochondrial [Kalmusia sp. IMI 367209]
MSLSRAVSSTLKCTACSTPIARALPRATPNSSALRASWKPSPSLQRPISSTARRGIDRNDPAADDPEFAFLDESDVNKATSLPLSTPADTDATPSQSPSTPLEELEALSSESPFIATEPLEATSTLQPTSAPAQSTLPWYLQNRPAPEPMQAAIIPELPPNPPPLLQTLVEYIANTAGMDDLLLYDLRHLDPPPALGSSLIMLICTARSEKHLHVSADRFCRYLRREHHLRANAAGLLGRNELKIKLRRKAKRMKMLANVGGAEPQGNIDDGIRTGWICCTVGKIEAHPEDKGVQGARGQGEGFVGFSDVKPGVNVVVQMFTEEKRTETDLEALWGGVLKTHTRNEGRAEEMLKALEEDVAAEDEIEEAKEEEAMGQAEVRASVAPPPSTHQFNKPRPTAGDVFPPASGSDQFQQLRRLHTVGLRG